MIYKFNCWSVLEQLYIRLNNYISDEEYETYKNITCRSFSNFIVAALKVEPVSIHGDGMQSRSFCYVTELVDALYRMMETDNYIGPVNTGNPDEFTMIELAE